MSNCYLDFVIDTRKVSMVKEYDAICFRVDFDVCSIGRRLTTEVLSDNFLADWGDGNVCKYRYGTPVFHVFDKHGIYNVRITGRFQEGFEFRYVRSARMVTSVNYWYLPYTDSLMAAFNGCVNLVSVPDNLPSNVTDTSGMFSYCERLTNGPGKWDVLNVTNMESMFNGCSSFNDDISGWDVSNVNNMAGMFENAISFNRDITGWNVSKVTNITSMFDGAKSFNYDLSGWGIKSSVVSEI
jgi:surface protein